MVKHIVMFKLKGTAEERRAVASQFKAALEALPEKIDVLRSIEVGLNQNPAETWDVVLTAVVDKWRMWRSMPSIRRMWLRQGCSVSIRICAPALTTSCRLCAYWQQTQGGVISFEGMPRFCIFIGCGNCVVFGKITYFCIK